MPLNAGYEIIDIRDDNEVAREPAPDNRCVHIPMHDLLAGSRGARSRAPLSAAVRARLAQPGGGAQLRSHGLPRVFSLRGGIAAL